MLFKGLLFIEALKKSLIRPSGGRKQEGSHCKNLIKRCLHGSFSRLFLTDKIKRLSSKDNAHLKGAARSILHLSEQTSSHLFTWFKNTPSFIFQGVRATQ